MKKLFYIGVAGLALFEIANVYFIMPMPGSQRMNSLGFAYFLYSYRWVFRIIFGLGIISGLAPAFKGKRKWVPVLLLITSAGITYVFNFIMSADQMFLQPKQLVFQSKEGNTLNDSSVVVGVVNNGQVKAYPVRLILYHHQVQDTIGGKHIIATYCNVCRTGRVYEPIVKGKFEKFRLVGMDHFNAMLEDMSTQSWWRQVNGEAVTGKLKGEVLPEMESMQMTIKKLFELFPNARVMQEDITSKSHYDTLGRFEKGKSKGNLTRTDSVSWQDKSWVVGVEVTGKTKAYDWNQLKKMRIINDMVGNQPIALVLASDNQSYFAFARKTNEAYTLKNDSIFSADNVFDFSGRGITHPAQHLKRLKASQEFWHSWKTFYPDTEVFK
ncbi:MAG: hypothetical protein OJF59_000112 [Cytophagales bacterium]|jgi:hypothetical protein|nr:DUF3179 domain-containing protein [Bacteroidota bacterium]MBS1982497.1 DUF3179 domain-containing protein [Bacteroidota bacterium]WHZ06359.1 MAG: hypothetical protein OJF59_000112 [Cytophagales bacterium]